MTGVPPPTVEWTKNNVTLSSASQNNIFISALNDSVSRVRIIEASIEDNGEYTCIATNPAGSDSETFLVQIMGGKEYYGFPAVCENSSSLLMRRVP